MLPSVVILNTPLGVFVVVLCHRFLISPCSIYSSSVDLGRVTVCSAPSLKLVIKCVDHAHQIWLRLVRSVRVAIKHDYVFTLISIAIKGVTKLYWTTLACVRYFAWCAYVSTRAICVAVFIGVPSSVRIDYAATVFTCTLSQIKVMSVAKPSGDFTRNVRIV